MCSTATSPSFRRCNRKHRLVRDLNRVVEDLPDGERRDYLEDTVGQLTLVKSTVEMW
jgi:hypothetical protein